MPKTILEFDVSDPHEREYCKYAQAGLDVRLAIGAYDQELRNMAKYWDGEDDMVISLHEARGMLWKHFEEHGVDWEVF